MNNNTSSSNGSRKNNTDIVDPEKMHWSGHYIDRDRFHGTHVQVVSRYGIMGSGDSIFCSWTLRKKNAEGGVLFHFLFDFNGILQLTVHPNKKFQSNDSLEPPYEIGLHKIIKDGSDESTYQQEEFDNILKGLDMVVSILGSPEWRAKLYDTIENSIEDSDIGKLGLTRANPFDASAMISEQERCVRWLMTQWSPESDNEDTGVLSDSLKNILESANSTLLGGKPSTKRSIARGKKTTPSSPKRTNASSSASPRYKKVNKNVRNSSSPKRSYSKK
jgi:hypothetical protein